MRTAIYPGSFDPVTLGHWDIIQRAEKLVDRLVVAVLHNPRKTPAFSVEERVAMLGELTGSSTIIEITSFDGLLVDFAKSQGAQFIVRGVRAFSDFEYEFQMAGMNRQLMPDVETVFLTPGDRYQFVSGTFVREIATLGGDVSKFVSPSVLDRLAQRVKSTEA